MIGRSRSLQASSVAWYAGHALLALGLGELDDQDRVLARQADQHDEADLREDVDVHLAPSARRRPSRAGTSARPGSPPAAATSSRTARRAPGRRGRRPGMKTIHGRVAGLRAGDSASSVHSCASTAAARLGDDLVHQLDGLARADARGRAAVDRRRRGTCCSARSCTGPVDVADRRPSCRTGPCRRRSLRILSCLRSSICLRKLASPWTFTCQVRPNRLKSLT